MSKGTSVRNSSQKKKYFDKHGDMIYGKRMGNFFVKREHELPLSSFRETTAGAMGSKGTYVYEVPWAEMYELNEASSTADSLGAQLSTATTPVLNIANVDAETTPGQQFEVNWAATNVDAALFQIPLEDFDGSQNITVTLRGKMASSNDTPVVYSKIVIDEADTVVADTSDTFTGTYANHTITIAAADLPATGNTITIRLTPAAHGTDILYMSAVKVEYGTLATADVMGGLLTAVSTPAYEIVNGDTDGQHRIAWAAGDVSPITVTKMLRGIDTTEDMQFHFRAAMASSNDTPTLSLDTYFNEGDTKVEDTTGALSGTAATVTATVAASDIPSGAEFVSVEITPGAHNTDALYVYGAWAEDCRSWPVAD
jgi:hypothetical protein